MGPHLSNRHLRVPGDDRERMVLDELRRESLLQAEGLPCLARLTPWPPQVIASPRGWTAVCSRLARSRARIVSALGALLLAWWRGNPRLAPVDQRTRQTPQTAWLRERSSIFWSVAIQLPTLRLRRGVLHIADRCTVRDRLMPTYLPRHAKSTCSPPTREQCRCPQIINGCSDADAVTASATFASLPARRENRSPAGFPAARKFCRGSQIRSTALWPRRSRRSHSG